jgi:peptidoglycan L-alanyl-D-glutamate endopeptidase CwlK
MILLERSLKSLQGVHPDLLKVVNMAAKITTEDFIITEGLRSLERQKMLVAKGFSKTMKSRHLTGHAVDFAPLIDGELTWKTPAFLPIIAVFKEASRHLSVPIESGSDWKSFKDYPHIQLTWRAYP